MLFGSLAPVSESNLHKLINLILAIDSFAIYYTILKRLENCYVVCYENKVFIIVPSIIFFSAVLIVSLLFYGILIRRAWLCHLVLTWLLLFYYGWCCNYFFRDIYCTICRTSFILAVQYILEKESILAKQIEMDVFALIFWKLLQIIYSLSILPFFD